MAAGEGLPPRDAAGDRELFHNFNRVVGAVRFLRGCDRALTTADYATKRPAAESSFLPPPVFRITDNAFYGQRAVSKAGPVTFEARPRPGRETAGRVDYVFESVLYRAPAA